MALLHKKINDKYMTCDVYYKIIGIDFSSDNGIFVYLRGYSNDSDKVVLDSDLVYTFPLTNEDELSYEKVYNLIKTLPEFADAKDC